MARKRLASSARGLSWFLWVRTATNFPGWKCHWFTTTETTGTTGRTGATGDVTRWHTTGTTGDYLCYYGFQCISLRRQQSDFTDCQLNNLRYLRHLRDKNITHADFADYADCQLIYLCSSVSLRLTKTDIHPLKSMGRCPAVRLPPLSYKSKLLTPKRKPDSTFLQKAYILFKAINRK